MQEVSGNKLFWQGKVISVQPRIRLLRSFDQRNHSYLGYALWVNGTINDEQKEFLVGIGKGAQAKHAFRTSDFVCGECQTVQDKNLETVEYYKTSKLKVLEHFGGAQSAPPPWLGIPPNLETYRQRGHRRLDTRTYELYLGQQDGCRDDY